MSFLAPLYIAGVLAISLPIIFHLIRRTPEKRQTFSSLMFLTPSPPRLSRRSKLTNILLLIMRAAALAALAFAFARPVFFRKEDLNVNQSQGSRVAILVDSSASMKRGDLWEQAKQQVDRVLAELTPTDEVALFFFDRQLKPSVSFAQWDELDLGRRALLLRSRLAEASPGWNDTRVGEALAAAAEQLAEAANASKSAEKMRRQIVLISDLQRGAHAEALQGHQWPENVLLAVKPLSLKQSTNASLQLVKDHGDGAAAAASTPGTVDKLRVRVSNNFGATAEQFSIAWANDNGVLPMLEPQKVYVAPGRSQVVRVAWPPVEQHADRLVLQGDDFDFDNTLFVVPPRQEVVRIIYLGDDEPDDARGLAYYLNSAAGGEGDIARRRAEFIQRRPAEPLTDTDLAGTRLVAVSSALNTDRTALLRKYLEAGGDVLWVLRDSVAGAGLAALMNVEGVSVAETSQRDFALLSRVDLTHPLFAPFTDPRFSDFSKVHFWKHRVLKLPDSAGARTLASFDNGEAFLIEKPIGAGRLLVATSGWQPDDSQLALSTKFVPLVGGLLQRRDAALVESQYFLGEAVALPTTRPSPSIPQTIETPDKRRIELTASATSFDAADRPGIYRLSAAGGETPLAINLQPDESRTEPLAAADLEQFGARIGTAAASAQLPANRQRQLQLFELENRQKMWRWLLVGVLGLVIVETALAGRLTRRGAAAVSGPALS